MAPPLFVFFGNGGRFQGGYWLQLREKKKKEMEMEFEGQKNLISDVTLK